MKTKLFLASALLFAASVSSSFADTWMGNSVINVNTKWYHTGTSVWNNEVGNFNGFNFGAINNLELGGHIEVWQNDENWGSGTVKMYYKIDNIESFIPLYFKEYANNNNKFESGEWENNQFVFKTTTIDISSLSPGDYNLSVYFWLNEQTVSNTYTATFTILPTINLANDVNNTSILSDNVNQPVNVVLQGSTIYRDGFWNTICLPFNIDNLAGTIFEEATVYTLTGSSFSNGTLTLNFGWTYNNNIQCINAGVPYIVKWSSKKDDISNPTFYNVTIATSTPSQAGSEGPAIFKGCFNSITIPEEGSENTDYLYLGAENTLFYPETSVTIGAFRGYFELNIPEPEANPIKAFVLNFDDETTSIQEISNTTNTSNAIYTLDGRRINGQPATAGLYIINGKKVMIK